MELVKVTQIFGKGQNADEALEASKGDYADVLIVGWHIETGRLTVNAGGDLKKTQINWLIDQFKTELLADNFE